MSLRTIIASLFWLSAMACQGGFLSADDLYRSQLPGFDQSDEILSPRSVNCDSIDWLIFFGDQNTPVDQNESVSYLLDAPNQYVATGFDATALPLPNQPWDLSDTLWGTPRQGVALSNRVLQNEIPIVQPRGRRIIPTRQISFRRNTFRRNKNTAIKPPPNTPFSNPPLMTEPIRNVTPTINPRETLFDQNSKPIPEPEFGFLIIVTVLGMCLLRRKRTSNLDGIHPAT